MAQFSLGMCYYNGTGVPQDYAAAIPWLRKAAEQENALAQNILGFCCYSGKGVEQDYAEAVRWLRKSAAQGNENAKDVLADMDSAVPENAPTS